jgi:phosphoethanolamine N-methyltransferase
MSNDNLQHLLPFLPFNLKDKRVLVVDTQNDDQNNQVFLGENVSRLFVVNLDNVSSSSSSTNLNVEFLTSNLNDLNLGSELFDLVFVNSRVLANYNQETGLNSLFDRALQHLNADGYLLMRDACHLHNRNPIQYIDLVESRVIEAENNLKSGYNLVFVKSNDFKACLVSILFQKTQLENFHGFNTLRDFMDHKQYSRNGVLTYEKIFGDGFVSTGGLTTTEKFLEEYIKPQKGQKLLDVGCGIGGGDFYISEVLNNKCSILFEVK